MDLEGVLAGFAKSLMLLYSRQIVLRLFGLRLLPWSRSHTSAVWLSWSMEDAEASYISIIFFDYFGEEESTKSNNHSIMH